MSNKLGPIHITPEYFENAIHVIISDFGFVFEKNCARSGKPHEFRDVIVFEELRFQNVFRLH